MAKHLRLDVRRSMNLTQEAYDRLRALNEQYGIGNNYLMTVLLSRLDDFADPDKLGQVFDDFIAQYGAPGQSGKAR